MLLYRSACCWSFILFCQKTIPCMHGNCRICAWRQQRQTCPWGTDKKIKPLAFNELSKLFWKAIAATALLRIKFENQAPEIVVTNWFAKYWCKKTRYREQGHTCTQTRRRLEWSAESNEKRALCSSLFSWASFSSGSGLRNWRKKSELCFVMKMLKRDHLKGFFSLSRCFTWGENWLKTYIISF